MPRTIMRHQSRLLSLCVCLYDTLPNLPRIHHDTIQPQPMKWKLEIDWMMVMNGIVAGWNAMPLLVPRTMNDRHERAQGTSRCITALPWTCFVPTTPCARDSAPITSTTMRLFVRCHPIQSRLNTLRATVSTTSKPRCLID